MKNYKLKSYCKINLSLRVVKKLSNGYHNIISLITFCKIYDLITISKIHNFNDKIIFSGNFKKGINQKSNSILRMLSLLRKEKLIKNQSFKINVKKNIPHGSGLGGGSSNAADLLNFLNIKMKLSLSNKKLSKLARKIGFDTPINLEKKNTFLTGKKDEILRLKQKFKLNLLLVYPNLICSTKKIYQKNKKISNMKPKPNFHIKNKKQLIKFLKIEKNDLQEAVINIYPRVKKVIDYIGLQKGCYLSRITGSGSACIGIFSNTRSAIYAKKQIKLRYPKYWSVVSKTI